MNLIKNTNKYKKFIFVYFICTYFFLFFKNKNLDFIKKIKNILFWNLNFYF